uniref:Transmembrane protein n=1 Tax=Meloidogyne incognita TaxID=6306 RepID=A0A914LSA9_MELIC
MLKYLLKNNYCRSKTLYICHSYFSIQNVNKTISRTLKSVASKPLQIVNFCVLRCYRGFLRFRALYAHAAYFDQDIVNYFYQKDKVNPKEWCITYNFPLSNLFSNAFRFVFCFIIVVTTHMFFDYKKNGKFTDEFSIRIHRDMLLLGIFGYIIVFATFVSLFILLKLNSLNISRIYLNRNDPDKLLLRANRFILLRPLTHLNRKDVHLRYNFDDNQFIQILRIFIHGSAKFGHLGNYGLVDDGFRNNLFRSFVLNETDNIPRMLDKLDLVESNINKLENKKKIGGK